MARAYLLGSVFVLGGCSLTGLDAPPLAGPSELSLSLSLAATPATLPQDGSSSSEIVVRARDAQGRPVRGLSARVHLEVDDQAAPAGTLSATRLTTDVDGRAAVTYVAPRLMFAADTMVSVVVTPASGDALAAASRRVRLLLLKAPRLSRWSFRGAVTPADWRTRGRAGTLLPA